MNRYEFVQHLQGLDVVAATEELASSIKCPMRKRIDAIVNYHIEHNPLYRSKLVNNPFGSFEDLPIMRKMDFQKPLKELISDEYKIRDLYVHNTSGSSGNPFFYAKNKESHAIVHSILQRLYSEHGIAMCDKQARFYGIPSSGTSRYIELLKDRLLNRTRFPIFDLSDSALNNFLKKFKNGKYIYIYGYTSAISIFAKYLRTKNIILKKVCPTLKACIVTSEVCTKEDRQIIEDYIGVKVINEYGCSEAGIIAFEDIKGVWRLIEDDCYFEIVDDKGKVLPEGSEGRLLITNLSNKAMPFIRYEVGDIAIITHDEQGRILKTLSGRVSDLIKLPSGKIAGGLTFYYISRTIMEKGVSIKEFIVRQTKLDCFEFDIVSNEPINSEIAKILQTNMDKYLEPGLNLKINIVGQINRPKSGKIKHFYSEI